MTSAPFKDNRLKLGVFGPDVSNGCAATTAEGHLPPTWQNNVNIAVMADRAGIEALVPVARWKGFGAKPTSTAPASRRTPGPPGWRLPRGAIDEPPQGVVLLRRPHGK